MNELEQLRKEINELRERVAVLEKRAAMPVRDGYPLWQPITVPVYPTIPCEVTCDGSH